MSSMSPHTPARALPARPRLAALKSEAKRRLAQRRPHEPGLKLSAVQFELARDYGFASWRALKASFDATPFTGDWIGSLPGGGAVCALSTLTSVMLVQMAVAEAARLLLAAGVRPPVYVSANVPGGFEGNLELEKRYAGRIRRTAS